GGWRFSGFQGGDEVQHGLFAFAEAYVVEARGVEDDFGGERRVESARDYRDIDRGADRLDKLARAQPLARGEGDADQLRVVLPYGVGDLCVGGVQCGADEADGVAVGAQEGADEGGADRGDGP